MYNFDIFGRKNVENDEAIGMGMLSLSHDRDHSDAFEKNYKTKCIVDQQTIFSLHREFHR